MASNGTVTVREARSPRDRAVFVVATLALFLLLLLAGAGQARAFLGAGPQWYWLNPQPQGNSIMGTDFADDQHGWAVGSAGAILATVDGGQAWRTQSSGVTRALTSVCFTDASSGWAVGDSGTILHTTDGGGHWTRQTSGTTAPLASVTFADALHGWAVGGSYDDGLILATTNGGQTWAPQSSPTTSQLFTVTSTDASHAWIGGDGGSLLFTRNGGTTWDRRDLGGSSSYDFHGLVFVDAVHGWTVDSYGQIGVTSDGGESWQYDTPASPHSGQLAIAADATRLWVVGQAGLVLSRPIEAGGTWALQTSGTESTLRTVTSRSAGRLVAGGDAGSHARHGQRRRDVDDPLVRSDPADPGDRIRRHPARLARRKGGGHQRRADLRQQRRWRHLAAAASGRRDELAGRLHLRRRDTRLGGRLGRRHHGDDRRPYLAHASGPGLADHELLRHGVHQRTGRLGGRLAQRLGQ